MTQTQTETEAKHYWLQATTNTLHSAKDCSITRRTRYSHFEVFLTDEEASYSKLCAKCYGTTMPPRS